MPLKLNIALSRKIGEPNYGSRGATVGLELEVDSNLVSKPRQLRRQIARLFRLAKASIDQELGGRQSAQNSTSAIGNTVDRNRPATVNQVRAIHAIARRQNVILGDELRDKYHVERPDDLSVEQASVLIDLLKGSNGTAEHSRAS